MTLPPSTDRSRFHLHQEARKYQVPVREFASYLDASDPSTAQADALRAAQREPLWPAVRRVLSHYQFPLQEEDVEGYREIAVPSLDTLAEIHLKEVTPRLSTRKPSALMRPLLEVLKESTINATWLWATQYDEESDLGARMISLYEDALAQLGKQHS